MVKNILVLRFGNPMFGAVWSCDSIDNIQVDQSMLLKEIRFTKL